MSRDPRYQKLLNDKRWKMLRAEVFRRANGLCEMCKAEGFITPGVDVHHIRPVEQAKSVQENKARARRRFMEANDPNWRPDGDD